MTDEHDRYDRRSVLRNVGVGLLGVGLAGCTTPGGDGGEDGEDGGDGEDGEDDKGGGGGYSVRRADRLDARSR